MPAGSGAAATGSIAAHPHASHVRRAHPPGREYNRAGPADIAIRQACATYLEYARRDRPAAQRYRRTSADNRF
jgi:hypothetical protein